MAEDTKTKLGTPAPTEARADASAKTVAGISTSYLPVTQDPLLGTTIAGRYLIAQKLGEGGMGTVYLATHTILEKQVALKVLHGEFARKPDLVERFIQEAKAASRIRHENVIDISDFGTTPEGLVFFAMELLQGHDLHDEVTRARLSGHLLPWARSKKIFLQICAALSAAHARGIVHRDLKPENVYLVDFLGDPDFVKLLDFGIAKLTETTDEGGRKLTKTGMLFGTPEYMSPEQARGEAVDHRVDIYAMGCILFQLVSGRVPFAAENFMGILSMHLTEAPPQIEPEVFDQIGAPRALAGVIDRALEKDRAQRWQSIDELANAVREVCGDPMPADRSGRIESVPAPATVTRSRPPTSQVIPSAARQRTEWTGSVKVPEVPIEQAAPELPSKKPFLIAGAVGLVVVVVAVAFTLRGGRGADLPIAGAVAGSAPDTTAAPGAAPGSAAPAAAVVATTPAPALPAHVQIHLASVPPGAEVLDAASGARLGVTPADLTVDGSAQAKAYRFHLRGYEDVTYEVTPDRPAIAHTEALVRASAAAVHAGHPTGHAGAGTSPGAGSASEGSAAPGGPVTHPDVPVTHPDTGPAAAGSGDDTDPQIKHVIPGLNGSGSGS